MNKNIISNIAFLPQKKINAERKKLEKFVIKLSFKLFKNKQLINNNHFMEWLYHPMSYWRMVEIPSTKYLLRISKDDQILDIGSPKLLSFYLSYQIKVKKIVATDLLNYFFDDYNEFIDIMKLKNLRSEKCDATNIQFKNNEFDKIFSISTIEHIPNNGDISAINEIYRVLKPGGYCVITVPYNYRTMVEKTNKQVYWKNDKDSFYQRRYSIKDIFDRFISNNLFKLSKLYLVGEIPIKDPYVRFDGTFIHNYHHIYSHKIKKILNNTRIPFMPYIYQYLYYKKFSYSTIDPYDPNVRYAIVRLQK